MDRRVDFALSVIIVAFGLFVLISSLTAPPPRAQFDPIGPYGFSTVVGAAFLLFGAILIARQVRAFRLGLAPEAVAQGSEDEPGQPASARRALAIMASTFGYAALFTTLGYVIATLGYVVLALLLMSERSWKLILLCSIVYTAATFVVFAMVLRVPLPLGPLNDLFVSLGLVDRVR